MPSKSMLPHTITLFNFVGEISYGSAYEITIIKNVMCNPRKGINPSTRGDNPNDYADLFVFDVDSKAVDINGNPKTYIKPEEWNELNNKSGYYTIQEGSDFFIKGECPSIKEPAQCEEALQINSAVHFDMGSSRMRHWEINGN